MRGLIPLVLLAGCGPGLLRHEEPPREAEASEVLDRVGPFLLHLDMDVLRPGTGQALVTLRVDLAPSGDAPLQAGIEEVLLKWEDAPGEHRWGRRPWTPDSAVFRESLTAWIDERDLGARPRVYLRIRSRGDVHEKWGSPQPSFRGRP